MKNKILVIIIFFAILFVYSKNLSLFSNSNTNQNIELPEKIKVGYFFEKNPFFYYNQKIKKFEGIDVNLINLIINKISKTKSDYLNRNYYIKNYIFLFKKVSLKNIPDDIDFIIGGLIYSDYLNSITKKFIKFKYFFDNVFLLKNKKNKVVPFKILLKNKIKIGIKLYSKSYYLFENIPNIMCFAFYKDLLNNLNSGKIKYALIDQFDLEFVKLENYNNIEIQETIYNETYVFLLNVKYFKYKNLINECIKKFRGDFND